jgi:hypothetical protein
MIFEDDIRDPQVYECQRFSENHKGREQILPQPSEVVNSSDTLIMDFWPPEM